MYWIGIRPGDVHLNVSSPGWAKHAWSNVFAPWNAEATVMIANSARFSAAGLLDQMVRCGVTTFCAPPTVWRMLIQEDLTQWSVPARELVAAGEPLNPEVIEHVRRVWGITIRDGYGQTETTAQIGNPPGQALKVGSMGRPLPGYAVALVDPLTGAEADEGEIALDLRHRPLALMTGYRDSAERTAEAMRGGYYHTGDVASRDADGYITYVGRTDDVFKASDYRISPFELESVLIEHEAVAEAAVVPSPDPLRLAVPKAYVVLAAGHEPTRDDGACDPALRPRAPGAVQARPPARVRAAAEDDLGQDPPRRAAGAGGRPPRRGRRPRPVPRTSSGRTTCPSSSRRTWWHGRRSVRRRRRRPKARPARSRRGRARGVFDVPDRRRSGGGRAGGVRLPGGPRPQRGCSERFGERAFAEAAVDNAASIRAIEKARFRREARTARALLDARMQARLRRCTHSCRGMSPSAGRGTG